MTPEETEEFIRRIMANEEPIIEKIIPE